MTKDFMRIARTAVALIALAACRSTDTVAPPNQYASISGTYTLTAFNGAALPYGDPARGQVLSDAIQLSATGVFSESVVTRDNVQRTTTTIQTPGTFTFDGTSITITISPALGPPGVGYRGSIASGKMTLTVPGVANAVYVYTKG